MCGRYGASWGVEDLIAEFDIEQVDVPAAQRLEPDWNIAPTKPVYAVLTRADRDPSRSRAGAAGEDGGRSPSGIATATRRLVSLRWGLVPFWAKDPGIGARMINARIETAAEKPAFREAFARRRCLLPADGWYEWLRPESAAGPGARAAPKQPFFIHGADGRTLALAGLYELWRDPTRERGDPAAWLATATVLTTAAGPALAHIHDRQPLLVPPEHRTAWLDPMNTDPGGAGKLLQAQPRGGLDAHPVSRAVNDHRNNGAQLIEPIAPVEPGDRV